MNNDKRIIGKINLTNELKIIWKINDAKNIFKMNNGSYIHSPPFDDEDDDNIKWFIEFYPSGYVESSSKYIGMYLGLYQETQENGFYNIKCDFEVYINNSKGQPSSLSCKSTGATFVPEKTKKFPEFSGGAYDSLGWTNFALRTRVKDNLKNFLNNEGELEIICKMQKSNKK